MHLKKLWYVFDIGTYWKEILNALVNFLGKPSLGIFKKNIIVSVWSDFKTKTIVHIVYRYLQLLQIMRNFIMKFQALILKIKIVILQIFNF